MMKNYSYKVFGSGLFFAVLFLAACSSSPPVTDGAASVGDSERPTATQIAKNESGLGTVAYNEKTRVTCRKNRRMTGSHLHKSGCLSQARKKFVVQGDIDEEQSPVPTGGPRPQN